MNVIVEHTEKHVARLCVLLILAAYFSIQSFAVFSPLFPLDDQQELSYVYSLDHWWQVLGADAFQLFRPVKNLIFSFFSIFPEGMTPVCRATAVVIGCISFYPVLALFRRVFVNERQALLASAVWLLAPTLVSSVAWLSCVNIQIMCAFGALMIVLHDKAFDADRLRLSYILAATMCLFGACLSYEQGVAVGPIVIVFDFYLRPRRFFARKAFLVYVAYAVVSMLYLLLRGIVGATSSLNGSFANVGRLDIVEASAYFTLQHFFVWLWPFGKMSPLGSYTLGDVSSVVLGGCWLIVFLLGVFALVMRRRSPLCAMGIAFAIVGFLPVSNIMGFGNGPYGDYYMGLPSMGLSILAVAACDWLFTVRSKLRFVCFTLGVLLAVSRCFAVLESARWAWLWGDASRACRSGIDAFPLAFENRNFYAKVC